MVSCSSNCLIAKYILLSYIQYCDAVFEGVDDFKV